MKSCTQCGKEFQPRGLQSVCSQPCAIRLANELKKHRKAQQRLERAQFVSRKAAIKTIPQLIAEAQTAFNAYIRERDQDQPCICCGKPFEPQKPGGSMDAGHWRSRGAAPQLRFHPDNCHGQRKNCNRPGGAKAGAFRAGMIERIGLARVEALEADNEPRKWTRDELIEMRDEYRARLKHLRKKRDEVTA